MSQLQLVKSFSKFQEEQQFSEESLLEASGLRLIRGSLTEIVGDASSGRISVTLSILASLTQTGEVCAVVDTNSSFDPYSAKVNGITLNNILWIKCEGNVENAFAVTDNLIQAKGFGAIWLNLNHIDLHQMRYIPTSYWYRFRTKIKDCPTVLIVTTFRSILGQASKQSFLFSKNRANWSGSGNFKLLKDFQIKLNSAKPLTGKSVTKKIRSSYGDV